MSNELGQALDKLIDLRDALYGIINDTSQPQEIRVAALEEHEEVALRVRALLARDLEQHVAALDGLAAKIKDAHKQVKQELAAATKAADVAKSVSKFLAVADKVVDKAKIVLPLLL
jgi:methyl-accepting chemotaxis protein